MNRKTFQQLLVFMLLLMGGVACYQSGIRPDFNGFWQGPHPEDVNKKFYIHIYEKGTDTLVQAYWTDHHFFNSTFKVDSLFLKGDSIRFSFPCGAVITMVNSLGRMKSLAVSAVRAKHSIRYV